MRIIIVLALLQVACGADATMDLEPPEAQMEPRNPSMTLSSRPTLAVGRADGPEHHLFSDIAGAVRLENGDVVVAVRAYNEIRRFSETGEHIWTTGRHGSGPGEFRYANLLVPCSQEGRIVIHGSRNNTITVIDGNGVLVSSDRFEQFPFGFSTTCAPSGRLVFSDWVEQASEEVVFRWQNKLAYADRPGSGVRIVRENIPGEERFQVIVNGRVMGEGPRPWGRTFVFSPTDQGVWISSGDEYRVEFLNWDGETTRIIQWVGPDQSITSDHMEAYRSWTCEALRLEGFDNWQDACSSRLEREEPVLPDDFPTVSRIVVGRDGRLWVEQFLRPGEWRKWQVFNQNGLWETSLTLAPRTIIQDAGEDWILVQRYTDDLGVELLEVYRIE